MPKPRLVITGLAGVQAGTQLVCAMAMVTIGRQPSHTLRFAIDPGVSRNHAIILWNGKGWTINALDSQNGTFVNDRLIKPGNVTMLKSGDVIQVGRQAFRVDWDAVPEIQGGPTEPVQLQLLDVAGTKAPTVAVPKAPPPARPYRWVLPGEAVEVEGRTIRAGLFYFGHKMASTNRREPEPSLINPKTPAGQGSKVSASWYWQYNNTRYSDHSVEERARFLDWMAADRPVKTANYDDALLFLSGLERRREDAVGGLEALAAEARRFIRVELDDPKIAIKFADFLYSLDISPVPLVRDLFTVEQLYTYSGSSVDNLAKVWMAQAEDPKDPFDAETALLSVMRDPKLELRTAFQRCVAEGGAVFRELYRALPKPVLPMVKGTVELPYWPNNPGLRSRTRAIKELPHRLLSAAPAKRLRELVDEATEIIQPYSRRLASRPDEAGQLPAVALLPTAVASRYKVIQELRERLNALHAKGGRVPLEAIRTLWRDWPEDRAFTAAQRSMLCSAVGIAGYLMEPMATSNLLPSETILIAPIPAGGKGAETAGLMGGLVASLLRADGREVSANGAVLLFGAKLRLDAPTLVRVELAVRWQVEFGAAKATKAQLRAVPAEARPGLVAALAAVATMHGQPTSAATTELLRMAEALGVPEATVYQLLHAGSPTQAIRKETKSGLDMDVVRQRLASSHVAASILATVFTEEEEAPVAVAAPSGTSLIDLVRAVAARDQWTAAEFAALAKSHGKMASAAYDALNDAALDLCGDPLLEGDDPIFVDASVATQFEP